MRLKQGKHRILKSLLHRRIKPKGDRYVNICNLNKKASEICLYLISENFISTNGKASWQFFFLSFHHIRFELLHFLDKYAMCYMIIGRESDIKLRATYQPRGVRSTALTYSIYWLFSLLHHTIIRWPFAYHTL